MPRRHWFVLSCALLVLGGTGCGSRELSDGTGPATGYGGFEPRLPALEEVARLSSADSDGFLIQQSGSGFATDLPSARIQVAGASAMYSPAWSGAAPNSAGQAAFALYRLTYDPQNLPVKLSLAWEGAAPAEADCWVGLSDWTASRWRWQQPAGGELELADPGLYLDAAQHCYVVVMLLGETPGTLATIGFGEPTPPPPPTGDGYTLFAPLNSQSTYLIDMSGNVVNQWDSQYRAGAMAVLLESGHLLRQANLNNPDFSFGGQGGGLEEFDWDGNLVWSFELSTATQVTHHDFARLPNGNILVLVSNSLARSEVVDEGRNPGFTSMNFWVDSIMEVQPTPPSGGNIVWEWHVMDHLVQNFDNTKPNFGDPAAHPELINVNFPPNTMAGDWVHANAVAYNPTLDQVMLTSLYFDEFWVIDHSTTTAEAARHQGGNCGRGGDLLYRWGNPQAYGGGSASDQQFFGCHHAHWIADGLQGAGEIMVFKNQTNGQDYSQVVQLSPPLNPNGTYALTSGKYGPDSPSWTYEAVPPSSFFSRFMGSAERLPGGETLITESLTGTMFVVDASGATKWEYVNPFPGPGAAVFRAERYLPDYPGLANLP